MNSEHSIAVGVRSGLVVQRSASVRAIATEAIAKQYRRTAEEANRASNFDCAIELSNSTR